MTREEAAKELQGMFQFAEEHIHIRPQWHEALAALSSACACGGREVLEQGDYVAWLKDGKLAYATDEGAEEIFVRVISFRSDIGTAKGECILPAEEEGPPARQKGTAWSDISMKAAEAEHEEMGP